MRSIPVPPTIRVRSRNAAWLRRVLHGVTATVLLGVPLLSSSAFRFLVAGVALAFAVVDVARLGEPRVHAAIARAFPVFRASETRRPSGALWLWMGYLAATFLPAPGPAAGILVAAVADPVASAVGTRFGPVGHKTWQGSLGVLVTACVALLVLRLPGPAVVGGTFAAVLLERWPGPFDDNLVMAPGVAATVALLA